MPAPPKDAPRDEEAFLARWSRRKRSEPEDDAAPDLPAETAEAPAEERAEGHAEERTDAEILADLDLPDPDAMKADDDFSAFMQARVPERLRRRALRVLWRSNPVLANLDELVDYGEDYTDAAMVVENMQTVYEVGKGAAEKWKRHLAALAAAEDEAEDEDAPGPPAAPAAAAKPEEPEPVAPPAIAPAPLESPAIMADSDPTDLPPPRHMRFAFD